MEAFPKIQYSFFAGKDQIVIRADSVEELNSLMSSLTELDESGESYASMLFNASEAAQAAGRVIFTQPAQQPHQPAGGSSGNGRGAYRGRGNNNGNNNGNGNGGGNGNRCSKCGSGNVSWVSGISKRTDKPYKGWKCEDCDGFTFV
jgi:hypothetical protein